jgi:hypothetical protein
MFIQEVTNFHMHSHRRYVRAAAAMISAVVRVSAVECVHRPHLDEYPHLTHSKKKVLYGTKQGSLCCPMGGIFFCSMWNQFQMVL